MPGHGNTGGKRGVEELSVIFWGMLSAFRCSGISQENRFPSFFIFTFAMMATLSE